MAVTTEPRQAHRPDTLEQLLSLLERDVPVTLVAGATDLMVAVNEGRVPPGELVDVTRVQELQEISSSSSSSASSSSLIRIGAAVPLARLERELAEDLPGLIQACRTVGSPQIRSRATLGGNLGTASPAGDTLPVLVAANAMVELASTRGVRRVRAREFFVAPGRTTCAADECIVAIELPRSAPGRQHFLKVGVRNAMVISVASVAVDLDLADHRIGFGFGSVGPRPMFDGEAEAYARTRLHTTDTLDDADIAWIRRSVAGAIAPIDDHRGSAAYRRTLVPVLVERGIRRALEGAS